MVSRHTRLGKSYYFENGSILYLAALTASQRPWANAVPVSQQFRKYSPAMPVKYVFNNDTPTKN